MAYVIEVPNALQPMQHIKNVLQERISIRDWVRKKHPEGDFPVPTICIVNEDPVVQENNG